MYCRKCGALNDDTSYKCAQCGELLPQVAPPGTPPQKIPNYLAQSILVTLLCCLPLGIPAIIFSAQVNGKLQAGDIQGAMDSSKKAKMWGWISFGAGVLFAIIYAGVMMLGAFAGAHK